LQTWRAGATRCLAVAFGVLAWRAVQQQRSISAAKGPGTCSSVPGPVEVALSFSRQVQEG